MNEFESQFSEKLRAEPKYMLSSKCKKKALKQIHYTKK